MTNYLLVLYEVAGVACLLLSLMWCFTVVFFCTNHPTNRWYETGFRFDEDVNTGPIVCCFLVSCFLFGSVTVALIHDLIGICNLFSPPVQCFLYFPTLNYFISYVVIITSVMTVIMFGFLCINCLCYFPCVRPNAGNICC